MHTNLEIDHFKNRCMVIRIWNVNETKFLRIATFSLEKSMKLNFKKSKFLIFESQDHVTSK